MAQQANAEETQLKIVAHAKDGRLYKGFLHNGVEDLPPSAGVPRPAELPPQLKIKAIDGKTHNIALSELKAVFFVKSFDGSKQYTETKFFNAHPVLEGIWARLHFNDNETIEGVIYNSLHFLTSEGFFLKPPDPHSNNQMMYVLKSSLRDFRIMGVRNTY
jgi:hypothetical protein